MKSALTSLIKSKKEGLLNNIVIDNSDKLIFRFVVCYIIIVFIFIALGPRIFSSDWISSSDFHACIEITSSFIAILSAIACVIYFFGLKSRYFLIVGLGFFICGSEDLIHGILGFERLFEGTGVDWESDIKKFIPGTYVAGRSMLAVFIIGKCKLSIFITNSSNSFIYISNIYIRYRFICLFI